MTETRESPRRRAVTVAGLACLAAGLLLMVWLPWPPFSYLLLFLAALVCGAITIARRRVWPGLALILLTIAAPPALLFLGIAGPQVADTAFRPPIEKPAYPPGQGPTVLIDEAHANFHTASGRYLPFAELLRRDGYVVKPSATQIAATTLRAARVLVIANATATLASGETAAVRDWVAAGGSLLLIADHKPFNVAARDLGVTFGVHFSDTAAVSRDQRTFTLVFRRSDGTLKSHPATQGINEVATFYGCWFRMDPPGQPLLVFGPSVYERSIAGAGSKPLSGELQGAVLSFGKGRVAVFGEAAMFSAQLTDLDRRPMGMNAPIARQNAQFLLNLMHWLTGVS